MIELGSRQIKSKISESEWFLAATTAAGDSDRE
jgi:hypothetical protein